MNAKETIKTSFELFDSIREPVIVLRDGNEAYRNSAAKELGPLPDEVTDNAPPFDGAVNLGGQGWQVSARATDGCTVYFLYRLEPDDREFMSALGIHLSDWLTELTVAISRFDTDIVNPQTDKYLSMMRHSIHAIRRVAANLTYLGGDEQPTDVTTMDLDNVVYELVNSVNVLAMGRASIEFMSDNKEKLFTGSQELLERALLNLLSNSMKAVPQEGIITVACEKRGGKAVITVADEGCGIPKEMMNTLFSSYNSLRSLNRMGDTGLGLAVTQRIVRSMGGAILASNRKPKGAKFVINLPLSKNTIKLSSPESEYRSNGMTLLQTELSCVLGWESYGYRYSD